MRQCHLIELVKIHLLQILTIHPAKFCHIKNSRGLAHMMIIKFLHQFIQCKEFIVVLRTPSEKCHKVNNRLCQKSLVNKIFIGSMTTSLTELLVFLIGDQRTMHINRYFPSECIIQTIVLRRRRKIFITSDNMCNAHQMVIHNIRKVVCRKTIGLDQDHIIQFCIRHGDIAINLIMESSCAFNRIVLSDNIRYTCCQLGFNFFLAQMQTMLVIVKNLFAIHGCMQRCKALFIAEAVISFALVNQFLRILKINALRLSLTLNIRAYAAILIRAFIMDQTCAGQCTINDIYRTFHLSLLVCIFYS